MKGQIKEIILILIVVFWFGVAIYEMIKKAISTIKKEQSKPNLTKR